MKLPLLCALSGLLALGAGCRSKTSADVRGIHPEQQHITSVIRVVGTLKPIGLAEIHAPMDGTVKRVLVKKGERVKQGDLLIELSADDQVRNTKEAELKAQIALIHLQQAQAKVTAGAANAEADVAIAKVEKELAELNVSRERQKLEKCAIRAKQDGVVQDVNVSEDQVISGPNAFGPGIVMVELAQSGVFDVESELNEVDVAKIALDQRVQITLDAVPGLSTSGKVHNIATPDKDSFRKGMFPVTVRFSTISPAVKMSMTANVSIVAAEVDAPVAIPVQYVYFDNSQPCVDVQESGAVVRRMVDLGADDGKYVAIQAGLSQSDLVVLKNATSG
jgi:RND family efflux transporter MFP subunit